MAKEPLLLVSLFISCTYTKACQIFNFLPFDTRDMKTEKIRPEKS